VEKSLVYGSMKLNIMVKHFMAHALGPMFYRLEKLDRDNTQAYYENS
jgi:hypothetical protein